MGFPRIPSVELVPCTIVLCSKPCKTAIKKWHIANVTLEGKESWDGQYHLCDRLPFVSKPGLNLAKFDSEKSPAE